jgi:hypothetical protein
MRPVQVIFEDSFGIYTPRSVDLYHHSLSEIFGQTLTFCYYKEVSATDVVAGMKPVDLECAFRVFVKLQHNEPVDLLLEDLMDTLAQHSEMIPDDI